MKHVIVQEPVDYIEFHLSNPQDKALFNFIYERLCMEFTSKIGYADQRSFGIKPRIYWNDNDQFIDDLLDILKCEKYESCTWKNCSDCNKEKCIDKYTILEAQAIIEANRESEQ